jgi:hypothetical protein
MLSLTVTYTVRFRFIWLTVHSTSPADPAHHHDPGKRKFVDKLNRNIYTVYTCDKNSEFAFREAFNHIYRLF